MLCSLLVRRKKRERETAGEFFPSMEHALLAVPHRIFVVVMCN
jgi:hypothetical protein